MHSPSHTNNEYVSSGRSTSLFNQLKLYNISIQEHEILFVFESYQFAQPRFIKKGYYFLIAMLFVVLFSTIDNEIMSEILSNGINLETITSDLNSDGVSSYLLLPIIVFVLLALGRYLYTKRQKSRTQRAIDHSRSRMNMDIRIPRSDIQHILLSNETSLFGLFRQSNINKALGYKTSNLCITTTNNKEHALYIPADDYDDMLSQLQTAGYIVQTN